MLEGTVSGAFRQFASGRRPGILAPMGTGRASLLFLGAAAMMVSADARVIDPMLKVIAGEFNIGLQVAAWLISAYTFPYGLCQLFFGSFGDRFGKVRVMAVALGVFALGTAACALVPGFPVFVVLRFVTGVAAAAVIPLALSYIGDKVPVAERQVALGRFMSSLMLGLEKFFATANCWHSTAWNCHWDSGSTERFSTVDA